MNLLNGCLNAIFIFVLMQIALGVLDKPYELNLKRKHGLILCPRAVAVSIGSASVAFVTGVLMWGKGSAEDMVLAVVLIWGMGVLTVTDWKKHVIPNRFLLILLAVWAVILGVSFVWSVESGIQLLFKSLAGGAIGAVIFFPCYLLVRKQLGAGDVKLAVVMGLYLTSSRAVSAYLLGTILCCVCSLTLVAIKVLGWKDGVALVPFLTIGTWVALLLA